MLGLVLLYWIGKYFYKLAEDYDKSKWGFAILGIVVYYAVSIVFVTIIMLIFPKFSDSSNDLIMSLIALPFGLLACYLFYYFLEKSWKDSKILDKDEIDNIGK
jgi:hypothetical protein